MRRFLILVIYTKNKHSAYYVQRWRVKYKMQLKMIKIKFTCFIVKENVLGESWKSPAETPNSAEHSVNTTPINSLSIRLKHYTV